ncbi:MAG: hypothetical protein JSU92_08985 [Deltaproteobacteria bacterium]|nr:MAG: hypothetical protein JSU92_08985 [Deltaproteobacteria bacterium]
MSKKINLVIVGIASIVLFGCTAEKESKEPTRPTMHHEETKKMPETGEEAKTLEEKAEYTCQMECFISDGPGKCPKCGMDMEKTN